MKIKPNEICLLNNTLQILINNFCIDAQDNTTRTKKTKKVVAFQPIEDDSLILVNAAQGLQKTNPFEDPFEDLMNKKNQK